jgi:hypothetical protein
MARHFVAKLAWSVDVVAQAVQSDVRGRGSAVSAKMPAEAREGSSVDAVTRDRRR